MLSAGYFGRPLRPSLLLDLRNPAGQLDSRVTFTRASGGSRFTGAGARETIASGSPRFDYRYNASSGVWERAGLLIEEARTNLVANNTMVGAVAGSPGTAPTGWSVSGSNGGITQTIVGTGTENGIAYVDFRYQGTATGSFFNGFILFGNATAFPAAPGDVRTLSCYLRLVAGSWTGVSSPSISLSWYTSGQVYITGAGTPISSVTGGGLATQPKAYTGTAPTNTAYVRPAVNWTVSVGVTVDFTLRIGLPQVEAGAFATSAILTSGSTATRAADVATVATSAFPFNPAAGTLVVEAVGVANISGLTRRFVQLDDGTPNNRLICGYNGLTQTRMLVQAGGVNGADIFVAGAAGTVIRAAFAFAPSDFQQATNGVLGAAVASGSLPTFTTLRLGDDAIPTAGSCINGYLRSVRYYPRRLSNTELQQVTA